jgi:hypothetical protein
MNKILDDLKKTFFSTNKQKVLKFLASQPNQTLMTSEIAKATKLSRAGVNFALRDLVKTGLVQRLVKGKTHLFQVDFHHPLIGQFKVLEALSSLFPLIKELEAFSQQIILFGSTARGENIEGSDIDLFILTRNEGAARGVIKNFGHLKIKPILKNPSSFAKLEKEDPTFYREIERGIILWEEHD